MEKSEIFVKKWNSFETARLSIVFNADARAAFVFPLSTTIFSVFEGKLVRSAETDRELPTWLSDERRTLEGRTNSQNDPINSFFNNIVPDVGGLCDVESYGHKKD